MLSSDIIVQFDWLLTGAVIVICKF